MGSIGLNDMSKIKGSVVEKALSGSNILGSQDAGVSSVQTTTVPTLADAPKLTTNYMEKIGLRTLNLGRGGVSIGQMAANIRDRKYAQEDAAYQTKLSETESMRAYDRVFGTHTEGAYPEDPSIARAAKSKELIDKMISKRTSLDIEPLRVGIKGFRTNVLTMNKKQGE